MLPTRPICWFLFAIHPRLLIAKYLGIAAGDTEEFQSDGEIACMRECLLAEGVLDGYNIFAAPLLESDNEDASLEKRLKGAFSKAGLSAEKIDEAYRSFYHIVVEDPDDACAYEGSDPTGAPLWIH